jgi:hypothetical protein
VSWHGGGEGDEGEGEKAVVAVRGEWEETA